MAEVTAEELWEAAQSLLQKEIGAISALKLRSLDGCVLTLAVPNNPVKNIFEKKREQIEEVVEQLAGKKLEIRIEVDSTLQSDLLPPPVVAPSATPAAQTPSSIQLNARFTFDNFVVGDCNRFAHAAAQQICRNPGRSYNPLFIHSKAGLGKTHLMHAIGNELKVSRPELQVVYIQAEDFVNQLITAIRENQTAQFRRRYRYVDVWLVDDIQFIAAIEGPASEEEFFHTFNTLCMNDKQVVVASDVAPRQLQIMNDRLRSRLEMGILADLRVPDVETRIAILEKKAEAEQVVLPRDILEYLAKKIESNVRVLEGALTKVCAFCSLHGGELSVSLIDEITADYSTSTDGRRVSLNEIVAFICSNYDCAANDLTGPKRSKEIAWPRQLAIYLARELTDHSLSDIGNYFGGRDHSTILYGYNKVADRLAPDNEEFDQTLLHRLNGMKADLRAG